MKYGIKVPVEEGFLWITEGSFDNLKPILFETEEEGELYAEIFNNSVVLKYDEKEVNNVN